jgi:hypothetical protein
VPAVGVESPAARLRETVETITDIVAPTTRESLLAYLGVLYRHLVSMGRTTPLNLSGGAAVVPAYGSTERTKDVDAFAAEQKQLLEELLAWAQEVALAS